MGKPEELLWKLLPELPEFAASSTVPYNGAPVLLLTPAAVVEGYAVVVQVPGRETVKWRISSMPNFFAHAEITYWCPLPERPVLAITSTKYDGEPKPEPGKSYLVFRSGSNEWVEAVYQNSSWVDKIRASLLPDVYFWRELPLFSKALDTSLKTEEWLTTIKKETSPWV